MENEKINLSEEDSKLAKAIHDVFRDLPKENIEYALNSTVLRDGFLETRKNLNKEIITKSAFVLIR